MDLRPQHPQSLNRVRPIVFLLLFFGMWLSTQTSACSPPPAITQDGSESSSDGGIQTDTTQLENTSKDTIAQDSTPIDKHPTDDNPPDTQVDKKPLPDITNETTSPDETPQDTLHPGLPNPSDKGTTDTGPIPSTCYGLLVCGQRQCTHPYPIVCLDQCAKDINLQGTALQRWKTLRTCVIDKCQTQCKPTDGSCLTNCAAAYCAPEWVACGTDQKTGSETCGTTAKCVDKCGQKQSPCHAACVSQTTPAGQTIYTNALRCSGLEKLGKLTTTQKVQCYKNAINCLCPQYNKEGQGTNTCAGYLSCATACSGNDICCAAKCRNEAQNNELQAADKASLCFETKCKPLCNGDKNCENQCVLSRCFNEYSGCLCPRSGQPGSGNALCSQGITCIQACQGQGRCCQFDCYAKMRLKSLQYYLAAAICSTDKCKCTSGDKACEAKCFGPTGLCAPEVNACVNDK